MMTNGEKVALLGAGLVLLGASDRETTNTGSVSNVDGGGAKPDYVMAAAAQRQHARTTFGPPTGDYPRTTNAYADQIWRWWRTAVRALLHWTERFQAGSSGGAFRSVPASGGGYFNFYLAGLTGGTLSEDQFDKMARGWETFNHAMPIAVDWYGATVFDVSDLSDDDARAFWDAVQSFGIVLDVYQSEPDWTGEVWADAMRDAISAAGSAVGAGLGAVGKGFGAVVDGLLGSAFGQVLLGVFVWKVLR